MYSKIVNDTMTIEELVEAGLKEMRENPPPFPASLEEKLQRLINELCMENASGSCNSQPPEERR